MQNKSFIPEVFLGCLVMLTPLSVASEPVIVAHRGASADAPENTLPAFELAWKQGADAIEGDFHLTKDKRIVCIHDKTTKRYCKTNLVVKDSTLAELKRLDVGHQFAGQFKGTSIPTLKEVLAIVPSNKKIYIEIKCGAEITPFLVKQVKSSSLSDSQIIIISFQAEVIRRIKEVAPQWKAYWLSSFRKDGNGQLVPTVQTVERTLKRIQADGFSSSKDLIHQDFIKDILSKRFEYHVWTIDQPAVAKKFLKWGAQSITTNQPKTLREQIMK